MAATDPLQLPADVVLVPVAELAPEMRDRLATEPGGVAIGRRRVRAGSRLLDAAAAELIAEFRQPTTVVDAVVRYSMPRRLDPHATLAGAMPVINRLRQAGLLVVAGAANASPIEPSLDDGEELLGHRIVRCVQVLQDTEVYEVAGDRGARRALKVGRERAAVALDLRREAEVLTALAGSPGPRLIASGEWGGRPYLVTEWLPGSTAARAAAALRQPWGEGVTERRCRLLRLCCAILDAYSGLHRRGVVHGDVHPRNLLIGDDGTVRVIDFGLARLRGATIPPPARGGLAVFFEPELAAAELRGEPSPAASERGEQYALGALLYLLLAGQPYLRFALERQQVRRQIAEELPRPLAEQEAQDGAGEAPAWPAAVGAVLERALAKRPEARFDSVAAMAAALDRARAGAPPPPGRPGGGGGESGGAGGPAPQVAAVARLGTSGHAASSPPAASRSWRRLAQRLGAGSPALQHGLPLSPTASAAFGSTGVAYFFYRLACLDESPELLATADLWAERAQADRGSSQAFSSAELDLGDQNVGAVSLYHQESGVHYVRGLVAAARGDLSTLRAAVTAFVAASRRPCPQWDLAVGRAGTLLGCAQLFATLGAHGEDCLPAAAGALRLLGDSTLGALWAHLDGLEPIAECRAIGWLGIAHGWAGLLYATLRWCQASATPLPGRAAERLAELAGLARHDGPVRRWPRSVEVGARRPGAAWAGWCHGSAGHVFLWSLAQRSLGEPSLGALAEGAGWGAWDAGGDREAGEAAVTGAVPANLCCGLAGRAYALLHLYRRSGERRWLDRARALGARAASAADALHPRAHSLFKGELGISLLAAELERPEEARFPLFEAELA